MTDAPPLRLWESQELPGIDTPQPAERSHKLRNESGHRVYLHSDFWDWFLLDPSTDFRLRKRANYCARDLLIRGDCARRKHVRGAAEGWLRTPLGGTGGSHFYLWWAPYGFPAVKGSGLEPGDVLVRAVRHHDETDQPLDAGGKSDWRIFTPDEALDPERPFFTDEQRKAAAPDGSSVRLIKGYPGSGKTTALQYVGSHRRAASQKVIYLTFSKGLARASEEYFQAFGDADTTVDVFTFDELLAELEGATASSEGEHKPSGRGIVRMIGEIARFGPQLGPWRDRPDELFAELHAHAVGRALPIEFRGMPATIGPIVGASAYVEARSEALGSDASDRAAFVAASLEERRALRDVFGDPWRARKLLDSTFPELPPRLEGVSAVLIDEVQDLTPVEAMFVLCVVRRIGEASGTMPELILAGDEAQTVRPTAFDWGWLKDLIGEVLGPDHSAHDEFSLSTNMRSPRAIAQLVEATRSHYRLLEKGERPGGLTYTEGEASADGRVFYCHVPTQRDWAKLADLFNEQPSAQLVYPGSRVPDELDGVAIDVLASDQAKGLDYDLVGVVDAGERQLELEALAERRGRDPLAGALGRNLADQFRVAVSRSRENLVLLDRGENGRVDAMHALMAEGGPIGLMDVDVDALAGALDHDIDPLNLVEGRIDEATRILDDAPDRARLKMRGVADLLGEVDATAEVVEQLVTRVNRLSGVAAELTAVSFERNGEVEMAGELRREATEHLNAAGFQDAYGAARDLSAAMLVSDVNAVDPSVVFAAAMAYPTVVHGLPELASGVRSDLRNWMSSVAGEGLPRGDDAELAVEAASLIVDQLGNRHLELAELKEDALARTAELAEVAGEFDVALHCYEQAERAGIDEIGRCLERLGRWEEAANRYEDDGHGESALRCVRQIPDLARAISLAERFQPDLVVRLRWVQSLMSSVDPDFTDFGQPLTDAERDFVVRELAAGMDRTLTSDPSVDAPTIDLAEKRKDEHPGRTGPAEESDVRAMTAGTEPGGSSVRGSDLVTVSALAGDVGLSVDDCLAVCTRLGIRAIGDEPSITSMQADRVRRRLEREQNWQAGGIHR